MVKLTSPCMSIDARGTLGNVLTFAKTGKVNYAKKHFSPANPRSNAQVGIRAMTKLLTQNWSSIGSNFQASFSELAEKYGLSLYHTYLKLNSRRWADHLMPIILTTSDTELSYTNWTYALDKQGRTHNFEIKVYDPSQQPQYLQCCFSESTPFTPAVANTKEIIGAASVYGPPMNNDWIWNYSWFAPDDQTYYPAFRFAITNGNASLFDCAEI